MRLTVRGEYALRALVLLGLHYHPHELQVLSVQAIADQQRIPKRFLEQILNELKSIGLVQSRRGIKGGYRLRLPPERITLAEVIRFMEGPLAPVRCVSERFYERCSCPDEARCGIRSVMKEVRDAVSRILEQATLAQVCARVRQLQGPGMEAYDYII